MSSIEEKDNLIIKLESSQLIDLKRILFSSGLTSHQFFGYVVQQLIAGDERALAFANEAIHYKKQRFFEKRALKKLEAESLYQAIENELANQKK